MSYDYIMGGKNKKKIPNTINPLTVTNEAIQIPNSTPQIFNMELVTKQLYDELFNENTQLKKDLATSNGIITNLNIQIKTQNITIDSLRRENELLKEKLKKMDEEICDLKEDNLKSLILIFIKDLNADDLLEKKLPSISDDLAELRENRNNECHFISSKNNNDLKNQQKYGIKLFLEKLPQQIIEHFETENEMVGIIDTIKQYLAIHYNKVNINLSDVNKFIYRFKKVITIDDFSK